MNHFYDPNWKPSGSSAKKLIARAIKRHEAAMKEKIEDKSKDAKGKGEGEDGGKDKKKDPNKEKVADKGKTKDKGPATEENVDAKIKDIEGKIGKINIDRRKLIWIWTHDVYDWLRLWVWSWWP